jgi:hypothetical protein
MHTGRGKFTPPKNGELQKSQKHFYRENGYYYMPIVGKIQRKKGYFYYVDKEGNIHEVIPKRGRKSKKSE